MAPTRSDADLASAGTAIPDLIGPGVRVLFCGINPGLRSASTGLHFARPGNRFWKVLHGAGFTDAVLDPLDQARLVDDGIGITNLVARSSARADEVSVEELRAGALHLAATARRWGPRAVAVLGVGAYRQAFRSPKAAVGPQPGGLAGAALWVLPNPSGLQAHYQLADMISLYRELRLSLSGPTGR